MVRRHGCAVAWIIYLTHVENIAGSPKLSSCDVELRCWAATSGLCPEIAEHFSCPCRAASLEGFRARLESPLPNDVMFSPWCGCPVPCCSRRLQWRSRQPLLRYSKTRLHAGRHRDDTSSRMILRDEHG